MNASQSEVLSTSNVYRYLQDFFKLHAVATREMAWENVEKEFRSSVFLLPIILFSYNSISSPWF